MDHHEHPKRSAAKLEGVRWKADRFFDSVEGALEDLLIAAAEWEDLDENARISYSYDLQMHAMDNELGSLARWHRDGLLAEGQEGRYRLLEEEIRSALPLLERFDVRPPRRVLEE